MDTKLLFQKAKMSDTPCSDSALWREFKDSQSSQLKSLALKKTLLLMFRSSGIYSIWMILTLAAIFFCAYKYHAVYPFILFIIPLSFVVSVLAVVCSPAFREAYDMNIVVHAYEKEQTLSGDAVNADS
ncbi:MAG: hypothetical protein ACYCS8_00495 [Acidithiobacillus sp.]